MQKRWADESSSDEGSVDADEEEPVQQKEQSPQGGNRKSAPRPGQGPAGTNSNAFVAYIYSIVPSGRGESAGFNTRSDIGHFFEDKGCKIKSVDVRSLDRDRTFDARIGFADENSRNICLAANGELYKGQPLRISETPDSNQRASGQGPPRGGRGGGRQDYRGERGDRSDRNDRDRGRDVDYGDRRGPGREDGRGRGAGRGREVREVRETPPAEPAAPAVRPKLVLAPRTLPVETIGKAEPAKSDIFGGGKAHDETEYEVLKKARATETVKTPKTEAVPAAETVFKLDRMKEAVSEAAQAPAADGEAAAGSESAPKGGRGGRGGGRGGGEGGRWGREAAGEGAGRGRGGRGEGAGRGRGSGRNSPRSSSSAAPDGGSAEGAAASTGAAETSEGGYVIEKPKDEGDAPAGQRGGRGEGGRGGSRDGPRKPREERPAGAGTSAGRGPRPNTRPATKSSGDGDHAAATDGPASSAPSAAERGARGGGNGKLFAATAKRSNLLQSKPKAAEESSQQQAAPAAAPAPALTEEERFNRAQEKFASKEKAGTGPATGKPKKVSNFAALGGSDSEDE